MRNKKWRTSGLVEERKFKKLWKIFEKENEINEKETKEMKMNEKINEKYKHMEAKQHTCE